MAETVNNNINTARDFDLAPCFLYGGEGHNSPSILEGVAVGQGSNMKHEKSLWNKTIFLENNRSNLIYM